MLKIQGLHKKYGNYHALDGLDMELKDGALFGFVGPNGAGKTTTIKSMTGLLKPDRGTVELDGKDMLADTMGLRMRIGYVWNFLRPAIIWRALKHENAPEVFWNR